MDSFFFTYMKYVYFLNLEVYILFRVLDQVQGVPSNAALFSMVYISA
jgi:hypothetical protein